MANLESFLVAFNTQVHPENKDDATIVTNYRTESSDRQIILQDVLKEAAQILALPIFPSNEIVQCTDRDFSDESTTKQWFENILFLLEKELE